MKQYLMIILILSHLIISNLYAIKTFEEKDHQHHNTHQLTIHKHYHTHNASHHQHNHSHVQMSIDFFTFDKNENLFHFITSTQAYQENIMWISNPGVDSLFRPPKI